MFKTLYNQYMKYCKLCQQTLPLEQFYIKKISKKTGKQYLHTYCKTCKSNYHKKHYYDNINSYKDRMKINSAKFAEQFRRLKEVPCTDCKIQYPYYVMDFDHKPGFTKVAKVSKMVQDRHPVNDILLEIAKCDPVCANCHRIRSYQRSLKS